MQTEFILIKQLSAKIAKKVILSQIDLAIGLGQTIVVAGDNGTGKTTFLNILSGIFAPNSGSIYIDNLQYSNPQQAIHIKRLLGYAPDVPPLYQNDTVKSYLNFIADIKGLRKKEKISRVNECMEIFNLTGMQHNYIYGLSKGTQQRVNLAQSLLNQPSLLILDEPTNGLDTQHCAAFCNHIKFLKKQNVTIIIASHAYTDIVPLCDYMLKIQNNMFNKILLPTTTTTDSIVYDHSYS